MRRGALRSSSATAVIARAGSWLLALLLGLGPALPTLHFVLLQHRLCPTHGELIHADGGDGAAAHAPHDPGPEPGLSASADAEHEHEHCTAPASGTQRAAIGRPAAAKRAAVACSPALRPSAGCRAHSSLALLAYAPKLAPPV